MKPAPAPAAAPVKVEMTRVELARYIGASYFKIRLLMDLGYLHPRVHLIRRPGKTTMSVYLFDKAEVDQVAARFPAVVFRRVGRPRKDADPGEAFRALERWRAREL